MSADARIRRIAEGVLINPDDAERAAHNRQVAARMAASGDPAASALIELVTGGYREAFSDWMARNRESRTPVPDCAAALAAALAFQIVEFVASARTDPAAADRLAELMLSDIAGRVATGVGDMLAAIALRCRGDA